MFGNGVRTGMGDIQRSRKRTRKGHRRGRIVFTAAAAGTTARTAAVPRVAATALTTAAAAPASAFVAPQDRTNEGRR